LILNYIDGAIIYGIRKIRIERKKVAIVIDRENFDKYLYELCLSEGVKVHLGKRIINEFFGDIIIGADGPFSTVAKYFKFPPIKYQYAFQIRGVYSNYSNFVEIFLDENGFFYIIPESEKISRIGYLTLKPNFKKFLKFIKKLGAKILEYNNGVIPLKFRDLTQKKNVLLVGDAAGQVKSSTGGGLYFGLRCAEILANDLKNYEMNWRKKFEKILYLHYIIRKLTPTWKYLTLLPLEFLNIFGDMNYVFKFFKYF
jgi:flavin-dependent dehydrogenase